MKTLVAPNLNPLENKQVASLRKPYDACGKVGSEDFYQDFELPNSGKQLYVYGGVPDDGSGAAAIAMIDGNIYVNENEEVSAIGIQVESTEDYLFESNVLELRCMNGTRVAESDRITFNGHTTSTKNSEAAFELYEGEGITINSSTFTLQGARTYDGLKIKNTKDFFFTNGSIANARYGLVYLNDLSTSVQMTGRLEKSLLTDNEIGLVIASTVNPLENGDPLNQDNSNDILFQWTCNGIYNNDAGVIGSGNIIDQASSSVGTGNDYRRGITSDENLNVDILWSEDFSFNYYHDQRFAPPGGNPPSSDASGTNGGYLIDGMLVDGTLGGVVLADASADANCGSLQLAPTSLEEMHKEELSLKIYPNPFQEVLNLEIASQDEEVVQVQVFNAQGKRIDYFNLNRQQQISTATWKSGLYVLRFNRRDGTAQQSFKLIKQ